MNINMLKKILLGSLILSLITVGILVILWAVNAPQEFDQSSQSYSRLNESKFELATEKFEITDESRTTPALGEFEGSDYRKLKGLIWFPKDANSEHPLLVFSHGLGSYHKGSRHIAQHLARNGYVVAAIDFPLSNARSPAGDPQLLDIVNQPGNVSVVIDHLFKLDSNADSPLYKRINRDKVGAYGLSLGGLTTALSVFHPDFTDSRIKTAVMMAPPLETFSQAFFDSNSKVNSLILSGSLDLVVPEEANASLVRERHQRGWFISLDKGSHLGFANIGNSLRWMENPDDLGCALLNRTLTKLELPDRWSDVLPATGQVLREVVVTPPCPELPGNALNGLTQQWVTRIAIQAFFDMNLQEGKIAQNARDFFTTTLEKEHPFLKLTSPR